MTKKTPSKSSTKAKQGFWQSLVVVLIIVTAIRSFAFEAFHIPSGSMKNTLLVGDFLFVNKLAYGIHTPKYIPFTNIPIPHTGFNYRDIQRGDVVVFEYPGDRDLVKPREKNVNYIKRCVAVAGDVVEIKDKQLYVNGVAEANPPEMRYNFPVVPKGVAEQSMFPKGTSWNHDNYGPLHIPKKGDILPISAENIEAWSVFIQREGHDVSSTASGSVLIDGKPAMSYTVQRDYLWMMGDNRDDSEDSRCWGFCPVENVIGSSMFVYWSWYNPPNMQGRNLNQETNDGYDPEESQNIHIRWSRFFRSAQ